MQLLRFLSRLAFICNICFLVASALRYLPALPDNELTSDIIVLGYIVAILVNLFVNLIVVILFLLRRVWAAGVAHWLLIVNFVFFIVQILLFYHFNHFLQ
ncbi:MAG TPA: hypothetical protein VG605_06545 [Puia sp.]|nr:hypothetical protein [Puia sp.]